MKFEIKQKEIRNTLLAAFVGTIVALILSPISQTISFFLNEYLSRPILAVEYIELIPKENPINISAVNLDELSQSKGYYSIRKDNVSLTSNISKFQYDNSLSSSEELKELKESINQFLLCAQNRSHVLDSLKNILSLNPSETVMRDIAAKYFGNLAKYFAITKNMSSLNSILLLNIQTENEGLKNTLDITKNIQNTLDSISPKPEGSLKIKVTILNRGGTDGLIRNVGQLKFGDDEYIINLKRAEPERSAQKSIYDSAVPVTVTNPSNDNYRISSVGKIDKNSMLELWYEVDKLESKKEIISLLWNSLLETKEKAYTLILFDHTNDDVRYNFEWSKSGTLNY